MRCIREIVNQYSDRNGIDLEWDEFDVRQKEQVPDMSYDIFISSGGSRQAIRMTSTATPQSTSSMVR